MHGDALAALTLRNAADVEYYTRIVRENAHQVLLFERELYVGRPGVFSGISSATLTEVGWNVTDVCGVCVRIILPFVLPWHHGRPHILLNWNHARNHNIL